MQTMLYVLICGELMYILHPSFFFFIIHKFIHTDKGGWIYIYIYVLPWMSKTEMSKTEIQNGVCVVHSLPPETQSSVFLKV